MEKLNKTLKNNEKAITLIALVITIIVLLILAGISISMLAGDNSILQKSGEAKEKTTVAGEKEQIQLEVLGSYESDGNLIIGTVNDNIKNHISGVTTDEATEFPLIVKYIQTGNTYKIDSDGTIDTTEQRMYSNDIKSKLIDGKYIQYKNKPYRVLYDINSGYNWIEIVSVNPLKKVMLGYDDPNVEASDFIYTGSASLDDNALKAAASYNRALTTLNEEAQEYLDEDLSDRARCVGSDPINPVQETTEWHSGFPFR